MLGMSPRHCLFALLLLLTLPVSAQETGVTNNLIRLGSIMDLTGDKRTEGLGLRTGLEAALLERSAQGRSIELVIANDAGDSERALAQARVLSERGVFAMIGNLGTSGTHAALPVLTEQGWPLIGFVSGSAQLRHAAARAVNFRASYAQEIEAVVQPALDAGLDPESLCVLMQDDEFGLAGLRALIEVLARTPGTAAQRNALDAILNEPAPLLARNYLGPVGIYPRQTERIREAYESLKLRERLSDRPCRLVITAGDAVPVAAFIAYARYQGEDWVFSALSSTGSASWRSALAEQRVHEGVIHTRVVPPVGTPLPLIAQARQALGPTPDAMALEGYIVGRLFLAIADAVEGPLTRENFLAVARGRLFSIDGLLLDFSDNNQGSDLVLARYLNQSEFVPLDPAQWRQWFQR